MFGLTAYDALCLESLEDPAHLDQHEIEFAEGGDGGRQRDLPCDVAGRERSHGRSSCLVLRMANCGVGWWKSDGSLLAGVVVVAVVLVSFGCWGAGAPTLADALL